MLILVNDRNGNNFEERGEVSEAFLTYLQTNFATSIMELRTKEEQEPCKMLRELRLHKGITQIDMARDFGTTSQYISGLEKGKFPISKKLAHKLAAYFNCDYRIFL